MAVLFLGTTGAHQYLHESNQPARLTDSVYLTLQCFVLNLTGAPGRVGYPWQMEVARFLAPLLVAWATLLALATLFRDQLDVWLCRSRRGHVVVCGLGDQGMSLLESLSGAHRRVVVIDRAPARDNVAEARRIGARVIVGDARNSQTLLRAGVLRADSLVVVCGSDSLNGEVLATVDELANPRTAGRASRVDPLCVQVQINSLELAEQLLEHELRFGPRPGWVALDYTCRPEMAAHRLLELHPPGTECAAWGTVVIQGAGAIPEALLVRIGQARSAAALSTRLPVVVVDPEASALLQRVRRRHHSIDQALDATACDDMRDLSVSGDETVYVCLEDESRALACGLTLQLAPQAPARIIVLTSERLSLLESTRGLNQADPSLEYFGILEALCDPETLLGGFQEELARAIHRQYVSRNEGAPRSRGKALKPWGELSTELRGQNRDQAGHYVTMLKSINARAVPVLARLDPGNGAQVTLTDDEVEELAEMEHDRWLRLKRAGGWEPTNSDQPVNERQKRHPYLVPYAQLDEPTKEKDRAPVRDIPLLLASLNYRVVRVDMRTGDDGRPSPTLVAAPTTSSAATDRPQRG